MCAKKERKIVFVIFVTQSLNEHTKELIAMICSQTGFEQFLANVKLFLNLLKRVQGGIGTANFRGHRYKNSCDII